MLSCRRILASALWMAAVAVLAACGTNQLDQIGAAAVVGDHRITVAELQEQAQDLAESLPDGGEASGDQGVAQQTILQRMIQAELLDALARDEGVQVSEADIDAFIDEVVVSQAPDGDITPLLAQNNLTEASLRDVVRSQLIAEELTERLGGERQLAEALAEKAEEIGVTVSPRYGYWNGLVLQPTSGSISEPESEPESGPTETPAG